MLLTCKAPLLGGVEDDAAGVSSPVLVADPDGVVAAVAEDSEALVAVEDDAAEAVEAVDAGAALEDEAAGFLIPHTASVSNSVGMGLFHALQFVTCLSIESVEPH